MPRGQRRATTQGVLTHAEDARDTAQEALAAAQSDPLAVENAEGAVDAAEQATDEISRPAGKAFTDHPFGDQTFPGAQSVADASGAFTVDPKTGKVTGRQ